VTDQSEIDAFVNIARTPDVITATFGDLMRVPGTGSSLGHERAKGADVRVVYSTVDALEIARRHPDRRVVFLGVGFETTAPTIAASILAAREQGLGNYSVFSAHKRVMPALFALMAMEDIRIDGFLLPGHVSLVIGADAYRPLFARHRIPCVIAGFEPGDVLDGIHRLVGQIEEQRPDLENAYRRAVTPEGNRKAQALLQSAFIPVDAAWRGMGRIPDSGLAIRDEFAAYDARRVFDIVLEDVPEPKGCDCGQIITGRKAPPECRLFRRACTPVHPIGPCMVSSEGTCAAYYRYHPEGGDGGEGHS
jgi:hydrogenase expression/formation protein HypD